MPPKKREGNTTIEMISGNRCLWKITRDIVSYSPEIIAHDDGGITSTWQIFLNWQSREMKIVLCSVNTTNRLLLQVVISCEDHASIDVHITSKECKKFIYVGKCDIVGCDSMDFSLEFKVKNEIKQPREIKFHEPPCKKRIAQKISNINNDFGKVLASEEYSDITLVAHGGTELKAHKLILGTRSEVFAAMFRNDFLENQTSRITIDDINANVLKEMLKYLYTGDVNIPKEMASELLVVANKYAVMDLQEMCEDILIDSNRIDTIADTLLLAERITNKRLKENVIEFIIANIKDVMKTENWKILQEMEPKLCLEVLGKAVNSGHN
ncbi:uncharacterized protein [Musca autumnalis]|uniref:uncharacterized protein n=1 Tax=Musca autumnalis TaxID=221902 RepID=UPI003CF88FF5